MGEEKRILILCDYNAVRSPMAQALLQQALGPSAHVVSAGVESSRVSPFAVAVMQERGLDISEHESRAYKELPAADYDLMIALSRNAWSLAQELARNGTAHAEYWDTAEPPDTGGSAGRDQIIEGYRRVRDEIVRHIANRFGPSLRDNPPRP